MPRAKIRNKKLYDFIQDNYINTKDSMSQQEIADIFGVNIGTIKNFMYRHELNKKNVYKNKNKRIKELFEDGVTVKEIAKIYECSSQYVYHIINSTYGGAND